MNVEELKMNNWVRYKNTLRKVVGIYTRCALVNLSIGGFEYITVAADELEPVDLTGDMIKINTDEIGEVMTWFYDPILNEFHISVVGGQRIAVNGNFKHVHELQQACSLCGLDELAKNFKVK